MSFHYRLLAICMLCKVLGFWTTVKALDVETTTTLVYSGLTEFKSDESPSPMATKATSSPKMSASPNKTSSASMHNTTVSPLKTSMASSQIMNASQSKTSNTSHKITVTPSHKTVTPSIHTTATPSNHTTVTPSIHTTVTPSIHTTVTPSIHTTVTPSIHPTVIPSTSRSVLPSHNTTVMPSHNMTIMPSSAHTVVPTSSVHPMPPSPARGNFTVKNKKQIVCLVAYMGAKFDVMVKSKKMTIVLPTNASANGLCDNSTQEPYITLQWDSQEGPCNFTMHFVKYAKKDEDLKASFDSWAAANLTFSLTTTFGSTGAVHFHSTKKGPLAQLSAKLGHSYVCTTSKTNFKLEYLNSSANVSLNNIEFQPFEVQDGKPGEADLCSTPPPMTTKMPSSSTKKPKGKSHAVAIAVGCSLAVLILIGVGAYFIRRRRRRNVEAGYRKL